MNTNLYNNCANKYNKIVTAMIEKHISVTAMESCTSGLISSFITDTPGASDIFKGAQVAYSNQTKAMFGVDNRIIEQYGVYSVNTAKAMAEACSKAFYADVAIGITGSLCTVDANNADSVPGVVYFCIKYYNKTIIKELRDILACDRFDAKLQVAYCVAEELEKLLFA